MTWQQLRDNIYYLDGSLRDILIKDTTRDDWAIWVDFVNTEYKTALHIYETDVIEEKIDIKKVFKLWEDVHNVRLAATVFINEIKIQAYFFDEKEIENDITPKEINCMADHQMMVDYMIGLSNALDKTVILTPENMSEGEFEFISVTKGVVTINMQ